MGLKTLEEKFKLLYSIKENIPFLKPLTNHEIEKVVRDLHFTKYHKDEIVVEQDTCGYEIYIIFSGECDVLYRQTDSKDLKKKVSLVQVATLKKKSFFGELSLVTKTPRSARVVAKQDKTSIISLSLDLENLQEDKELDSILLKIYKVLLVDVSSKLLEINKKLHDKTLFRTI